MSKKIPVFVTVASLLSVAAAALSTVSGAADAGHVHDHKDGVEDQCWYRDHLLVAQPGAVSKEMLAAFDLHPLGADSLGKYAANVDAKSFQRFSRALEVFDVGDRDPMQVATAIRAKSDIGISPVLLTTVTGHWTFASGTAPDDSAAPPSVQQAYEPTATVGVVDTGYTETAATPAWLAQRVEPATAGDGDTSSGTIAGHGKFVASVIAQRNPNARIIVANMANVASNDFYQLNDTSDQHDGIWTNHQLPTGNGVDSFASDELQLYFATQRLLDASAVFDVLNLSVGTYQCSSLSQSGLAVHAALQLWFAAHPNAPIVAAAGNHGPEQLPPGQFLPGQMDPTPYAPSVLVGVESIDSGGTLSSFSNVGMVKSYGEDVLGVRLDGAGTLWSGTSFASAIVTGALSLPGAPNPIPGQIYP